MASKMLAGFALFADPATSIRHAIMGVPIGTRLMRVVRLPTGWRIWVATADFIYGTYYELNEDGSVLHYTAREDEGDEFFSARPSDEDIRNAQGNR